MSKISPTDRGLADYVLELTEDELDDLKATAKAADGRKAEVKHAREILGIRWADQNTEAEQ